MCERCTRAWLPMNHRNSHTESWGDSFRLRRLWKIRNPFAELRRRYRMQWPSKLSDVRRQIQRTPVTV